MMKIKRTDTERGDYDVDDEKIMFLIPGLVLMSKSTFLNSNMLKISEKM